MNRKVIIIVSIVVTVLIIIGVGLALFFSLRNSNSGDEDENNMCTKINKKYNLNENNEYTYETNLGFPMCCPESCENGCFYTEKIDKCTWKEDKDEYGTNKFTLPPYSCQDILDDESKKGNVCYIE